MEKILIFGHKNPDTDSITSSLVLANLERELGNDVEACRLGKINKETEYVLNYLGIEAPKLIENIEDGSKVMLVDHASNKESIENVLFIGYKNNKVTNMLKALDGFNEDLKNSNNFDEMQKKTANRNIKNTTSSSVSTKTKSKVSEIVNIPSKDETENVGE